MIKLATEAYQDFIDFLNNKHFTDKPCYIVVMPTYATVGDEEHGVGFAAYAYDNSILHTIIVAGDREGLKEMHKEQLGEDATEEDITEMILCSIAHEYIHHLQWAEGGVKYDEEEAETGARQLVDEFYGRIKA